MIRLLVSVRNPDEAIDALHGGADLIDVKEPARGALGRADDATIRDVVRAINGRAPLSVALGELLQQEPPLSASTLEDVQYAKFGLAQCGRHADWTARWRSALATLPRRVTPVAVVYADWQRANAPEPMQVLACAASFRCGAVLVDTFDKTAGPLTSLWREDRLKEFIREVRRRNLLAVVGGSLCRRTIGQVAHLEPDFIAVRGAACGGDRSGPLQRARVRQLTILLRDAGQTVARPTH